MKKLLRLFISGVLSLALLATSTLVFAADEPGAMNISWKGCYGENTELEVTFKSPALYTQRVIAVLYNDEIDAPAFNDYLRIAEITSEGGAKTTFRIKLGNDLSAADGKYKLTLTGNGSLSKKSVETVTVTILTPANKASNLLAINQATTPSELDTALAPVADALQIAIPTDSAAKTELLSGMLSVRTADYNGSFAIMDQVKEAYLKSEAVCYLQSAEVTAEGLCERVENNAVLFGFDTTNADYGTYKTDIYNKVISLKKTYKNTGITDWHKLILAVEETTAVEKINNCETTDIEENIDTYYRVMGITETSYNTYKSLIPTKRSIVDRSVYKKGFTTVEQIKSGFEAAVSVEATTTPPSGVIPETPGQTGTTSSVTTGGVPGGTGITTPPTPAKTGFTDVKSNHWAYEYINKLSDSGIVSGYPDGTFKPDNTVTREEFVKMIISAGGFYNDTAECDFADVSQNDWFYRYVASAKERGAVNGVTDTHFGVGQNISRQDVAVVVARLLGVDAGIGITDYTDDADIADYAKASVKALTSNGIIGGFDDGSFMPMEKLTRAQAAKIISIYRDALK